MLRTFLPNILIRKKCFCVCCFLSGNNMSLDKTKPEIFNKVILYTIYFHGFFPPKLGLLENKVVLLWR